MANHDGTPVRITILSLSASEPSVGRQCIPTLEAALKGAGASPEVRDIRDLPPVWVDKREVSEYPQGYADLYAQVEASDGVILVLPIHCYTMSGPAKTITEIMGDALTRKPVAVVSAAGSPRSHLAVRDLMASMMFEQETICFPGTVQATEDMLRKGSPNKELRERLTTLGTEFVSFVQALRPFVRAYNEADVILEE